MPPNPSGTALFPFVDLLSPPFPNLPSSSTISLAQPSSNSWLEVWSSIMSSFCWPRQSPAASWFLVHLRAFKYVWTVRSDGRGLCYVAKILKSTEFCSLQNDDSSLQLTGTQIHPTPSWKVGSLAPMSLRYPCNLIILYTCDHSEMRLELNVLVVSSMYDIYNL